MFTRQQALIIWASIGLTFYVFWKGCQYGISKVREAEEQERAAPRE